MWGEAACSRQREVIQRRRVVYLLRFGESARGATAAAGRDVGSVCPEAGSEPADGGCTPRKGFRASGCPPNSPS